MADAECNPPHSYSDYYCWLNWQRLQQRLSIPAFKVKTAILTSYYKTGTYRQEAESSLKVDKSLSRIDEARKDLLDTLQSLAYKETGLMGKHMGEFASDEGIKRTPKARKIKHIISPSVQISSLESKAVTEGALDDFLYEQEKRPI